MSAEERAKLRESVRAALAAAEGDLDVVAGVLGLPRMAIEELLDADAWEEEEDEEEEPARVTKKGGR